MDTLNILSGKDFEDVRESTMGTLSGIYITEANFRTLLFKYNKMVQAVNKLTIKVYDIEQATKGINGKEEQAKKTD